MRYIFISILILIPFSAFGQELTGQVDFESRYFPNDALLPEQHASNLSLAIEPELYMDWAEGLQSLTVTPFVRLDLGDSRRTHVDLREAYWHLIDNTWEVKVGFNKIFWGVTESQHLVDIINQTDQVEAPDGEDKLGQPMVQWTWLPRFGIVDVFVMPLFRERTFPGTDGRLRFPLLVSPDHRIRHERVDLAIRWSHPISIFDVGVSHFWGTSREPRFSLLVDEDGQPQLDPQYETIHQTGVDVQATFGGWLWKVESILRSGQGDSFGALVGGFEYTFGNVANSGADIGALAEYHYDSREGLAFSDLNDVLASGSAGDLASLGPVAVPTFQNDLFVGTRLALNDVQSTEFLGGGIIDMDTGTTALFAEASRRVRDQWTVSLEARGFANTDENDPFYSFRRDTYVELLISYYY